MKRPVLIILLFSVFYSFNNFRADAQLWKMRRFEAVAGLGPTFFFGDIGGYSKDENILGLRDLSFLQTRVNLNLSLKYRILQDLNIRLSLSTGFLHATDDRGSNETRAYNSTISIFEPVVLGEYYFIKNSSENSYLFTKGREKGFRRIIHSLDFYFFSGIGGLSYHSRGNDRLVNSGLKSKGFTTVIPVGIGTTMIYSSNLNFGVEVGGRYSFSDYLDGYSSQYSSSNDVYYFLNFTITYKMKTGPKGWPSFRL